MGRRAGPGPAPTESPERRLPLRRAGCFHARAPGGPVCRPYKNAETCPMNAVGAGPKPAHGLLPGVRAFKTSPSSGPLAPPTPFVPPGHFPLSGGIVLPPGRGKACGRPKAAPTAESGPGALARQSQAQFWIRNNSKFCKPRAQWPGLNSGKPLRFCAPEMLCLAQGVTPVNGVRGKATMSTKCSSGAGPYPLCPFGTSPLDKGSRPRGGLPNPSLLPAKPSEAGSPGRGGARERTQFSPPGGNGVEWTLRRRAAMGKVGRRPQAAKSPMKRSPLRSGHRVVAQASFFDPAGQFIFSHPTEKPPPLSACHSADPPASRAGAQNKMERTARRGQSSLFSFYSQII